MARALRVREPTPILDINTTPLIDVMLVLLIMFIITIPIQTHAVKIDVPQSPPPEIVNPVSNKIVITQEGTILWNGGPTTLGALATTLPVTQRMTPIPELHLQPEPGARYELVDEVLAITKRAEVTRMGFVGNEAYERF